MHQLVDDLIEPTNVSEFKEFWLKKHPFLPDNFYDLDNIPFQNDFSPEEKKLIDGYDDGEDDFGFFIMGDTGVGKTFVLQKLCIRFINSCIKHGSSPAAFIRYYPLGILVQKLRNFKGNDFDLCLNTRFLLLDDLGAEYASEFSKEQILTILDTRLAKKYPTFITTNLSFDEIKAKYGERISSRIKEMCLIIKLKGADRRNKIYQERTARILARSRVE